MAITEKENEETIRKLDRTSDTAWKLFLGGDEKAGIRPGDIRIYAKIAGMREVKEGRIELREEFRQEQHNK